MLKKTKRSAAAIRATGSPAQAPEHSLFSWARSAVGIALFLFVAGAMFLKGQGEQRYLGIFLGGIFFLSYVLNMGLVFRRMFPLPPELVLYTLWVIWAGFTGLLVAKNMNDFFYEYRVVLQVCGMVWAVYAILRVRPETMGGVFMGIVCGGVIQIISVALGLETLATGVSGERVKGLTDNPNVLGFAMVWSAMAAFFLWGVPGRLQKLIRLCVLGLLSACGYVILTSGSRKNFLGFLLLIGLWAMWASIVKKSSFGRAGRMIVFLLFLGIIVSQFTFVAENTYMGQRFKWLYKGKENSVKSAVESNDRYWMYRDGWNLFLDHPVCGVAIGNFGKYYWSGEYSHSDYMEPLATTGLIGFILYHAFNLLLLRRSVFLARRITNEVVLYRLKMVAICILVKLFLGIGAPFSTGATINLMMILFCVYTRDVEGSLRTTELATFKQRRVMQRPRRMIRDVAPLA